MDELEHHYASQFFKGFGAPAKPFRMAIGALIIKERLQATDEELVEQIKENSYLQFFLSLEGFQYQAPFDPSMMVHFRRRLPTAVVNDCNERIVRHAKQRIDEESQEKHDDPGDGNQSASSSSEGASADAAAANSNQGSLLIDATCVPGDIRYATDLSLLTEARETTEKLIDAMHRQVRDAYGHKPRTHRRKARLQFLAVAEQKRPRRDMIRKAFGHQLRHLGRNLASIDALIACDASLLLAG